MPRPTPTDRSALPWWGLGLSLALLGCAMAVPALTGWDVHVRWFPPLHAEWDPRVGVGTVPALVLALVGVRFAVTWSERLTWRQLLVGSFLLGLAWMLALALVDGREGLDEILQTPYEYLRTARRTTDLGATLHEYVSRISYDAAPRNWPVHVAGHPPGALLFFVVLVRLGLGGGLSAGLVVTVVAATTAPAVLILLRTLGAERMARAAAPFLVLGPAAIWQAVSADAVFAAVAAWGLVALGLAATRRGAPSVAWSLLAGGLLGYAVMMSYGLPLLGIAALAVLWTAGRWTPLPAAALAACAVVGAFAVAGFAYWEALPEIHERYWDGVASRRPPEYWLWGNLAALLFSAGPLAGVGLGSLLGRLRDGWGSRRAGGDRPPEGRVVVRLATAGWLMVLAADLSQMSRAEVERIWLPFVPWVLVGCALLPPRWRRAGLVLQVGFALVVQHLLFTGW